MFVSQAIIHPLSSAGHLFGQSHISHVPKMVVFERLNYFKIKERAVCRFEVRHGTYRKVCLFYWTFYTIRKKMELVDTSVKIWARLVQKWARYSTLARSGRTKGVMMIVPTTNPQQTGPCGPLACILHFPWSIHMLKKEQFLCDIKGSKNHVHNIVLQQAWKGQICLTPPSGFSATHGPELFCHMLRDNYSRPRTAFQISKLSSATVLLSPRALHKLLPDLFRFWTYIQGFPHLWHTRY